MITVIAARSRNRVIGKDGQIPWHIPADLKRFKELTTGNVVIMGRKTYESIGKPLPNRVNIVVSSSLATAPEDVWTVSNFEKALEVASDWNKPIFIIGGQQIYQAAFDAGVVDAIELTLVNTHIENGDAVFPFTSPSDWIVTEAGNIQKDDVSGLEYVFLRYSPASEYPPSPPLLYLPAARFDNQAGYMEEILNDGICPFCPQWLAWYHQNPIANQSPHWIVTKNDNPYKGTIEDLLLIPKSHVENFDELSLAAKTDFGLMISWVIHSYGLDYGALGMRFGDMSRTGGSVAHLHAHIKVGDVDNPNHTPVRFKMSSVPQDNKSPDQFD